MNSHFRSRRLFAALTLAATTGLMLSAGARNAAADGWWLAELPSLNGYVGACAARQAPERLALWTWGPDQLVAPPPFAVVAKR